MIWRPPRSTRDDTLLPNTALCRPGPGIGGGHLGNGRDFWRGEPGLQRSRDPAGDLAFDAEDVVQGALVALGPDVVVGPGIDQLHRNQNVVADLLHAAFNDMRHAQFPRDLL